MLSAMSNPIIPDQYEFIWGSIAFVLLLLCAALFVAVSVMVVQKLRRQPQAAVSRPDLSDDGGDGR